MSSRDKQTAANKRSTSRSSSRSTSRTATMTPTTSKTNASKPTHLQQSAGTTSKVNRSSPTKQVASGPSFAKGSRRNSDSSKNRQDDSLACLLVRKNHNKFIKESSQELEEPSNCSEMATTSLLSDDKTLQDMGGNLVEQETSLEVGNITNGDNTDDDESATLLDSPALVIYHDDEEIDQTVDAKQEDTFVVYPLGSCAFDETQLVSTSSTKAIQKCILRLSNHASSEETMCWGLDQNQPIVMRLLDDHIQFTDAKTQSLLRSQPIQTIKTWAVDDENNFAFVVEDKLCQSTLGEFGESSSCLDQNGEYVDYALLTGPSFVCYVFRSLDDDDMSCRVARKLNEEINRYREQMSVRIKKSTRLQQMVAKASTSNSVAVETAADDQEEDDEEPSEVTLNVKYIGQVQVPQPTGIDVLNIAIDKCLAEASKLQQDRLSAKCKLANDTSTLFNSIDNQQQQQHQLDHEDTESPLIDVNLHVSPSSIIVENESNGEIIVECRIRYLTFMGISRRDIRWCGFIMQNTTNKTFVAHCFECYPTAGNVCDAIQASCSRMYERMVKNQRQQTDSISIMPKSSKIRDTLAKTLSRLKLTPII